MEFKYIEPPKMSDGSNGEQQIRDLFEPTPFMKENMNPQTGINWYRRLGEGLTGERNAVLAGLPAGYALGTRTYTTPNGEEVIYRQLYGHPSRKPFRSAVEFVPHLQWLNRTKSKSFDHKKCPCRICKSWTKQRDKKKETPKKVKAVVRLPYPKRVITIAPRQKNERKTMAAPRETERRRIHVQRTVRDILIQDITCNTLPIPDVIPIPNVVSPALSVRQLYQLNLL